MRPTTLWRESCFTQSLPTRSTKYLPSNTPGAGLDGWAFSPAEWTLKPTVTIPLLVLRPACAGSRGSSCLWSVAAGVGSLTYDGSCPVGMAGNGWVHLSFICLCGTMCPHHQEGQLGCVDLFVVTFLGRLWSALKSLKPQVLPELVRACNWKKPYLSPRDTEYIPPPKSVTN